MELSDLKYWSILKDFDFNQINRSTFPILIEQGIFDIQELSSHYQSDKNYFGIELSENTPFNTFFIFNRKEYHIKQELISEMVEFQEYLFKIYEVNADRLIHDVEIQIEKELLIPKKIEILEAFNEKIINELTDNKYYFLYKENIPTEGYHSWKHYFLEYLEENEQWKFISFYLQGIIDFVPDELKLNWRYYHVTKELQNFIAKKINSIMNPEQIEIKNSSDDGKNSTFEKVILLEEILNDHNWADYSASQKGKVLSILLGYNEDNIKKKYLILNKTQDALTDEQVKRINKTKELYKAIVG